MPEKYHIPVMLHEAVDALQIKPNGIYVDATLGGAGHTKLILSRLGAKGKLYVFDQDADAKANLPQDERVVFIHQNFRHLKRMLRMHGVTQIDGLLADLGVSSHQFDEATRGFSIRFDGALDMRMDVRQEKTAAKILNSYGVKALQLIFQNYGEVTNSKTLAQLIDAARKQTPFTTTEHFKAVVAEIVKGNPNRYFAQVFQALRIEVNEEMQALKELLEQSVEVMAEEAVIAVITFHSLEDKLVKNFFKRGVWENDGVDENPFSTEEKKKLLTALTKKPIEPTAQEQKENSRSRSAKLRVAKKI
jgi:16S rRNA (cytosine1402-N4)-methyltransferase